MEKGYLVTLFSNVYVCCLFKATDYLFAATTILLILVNQGVHFIKGVGIELLILLRRAS